MNNTQNKKLLNNLYKNTDRKVESSFIDSYNPQETSKNKTEGVSRLKARQRFTSLYYPQSVNVHRQNSAATFS